MVWASQREGIGSLLVWRKGKQRCIEAGDPGAEQGSRGAHWVSRLTPLPACVASPNRGLAPRAENAKKMWV
jgi:hypothetical protein